LKVAWLLAFSMPKGFLDVFRFFLGLLFGVELIDHSNDL
jgi:hypothetical protein